MDRKGLTVSQQDYERIVRDATNRFGNDPNQISFGQRFEQLVNQKLTDNVLGGMVDRMFGTGPAAAAASKARTGAVGAALDFLDTSFAAQIGKGIGENITGLIKELGSERIGRVIDNYTGRPPTDGQQQIAASEEQKISPEEQQKRSENALMALDSNNIEHLNAFMQATGIKNVSDAQKVLLSEQAKILQSRGLVINNETSQPIQSHERQRKQSKNEPEDLNRRLIQQYEDSSSSSYQDFPSSKQSPNIQNENSFFNDSPQPSVGTSQSPDEVILSLSPDDPVSIHTYASMRNLNNLDATTIRKTLIKEQEHLRKNMSVSPQSTIQELPLSTSQNESGVDSKWTERDKPRVIVNSQENSTQSIESEEGMVMKKSDFYKEIGLDKSSTPQQTNSLDNANTSNSSNNVPTTEIGNIVALIEGLGNNFESNMKYVSDTIQEMSNKMHSLEDEITTLKSKIPNEIVYPSNPDIEDVIVTNENISDIIERRIRTPILNDVTKEDISDGLKENPIDTMNSITLNELHKDKEEAKDDSSESFSDIGEDKSEISKTEDKDNENNIKKKFEVDNEHKVKPKFTISRRSRVENLEPEQTETNNEE